jgi:hypothetical protein
VAAVRASRTNGFTLVGSAAHDPGHSLLTRERRPTQDGGSGGLVWPLTEGEVSSPSTPSVSLGVPDVSRLRPVQGALSKARSEKGFTAHSRSTEPLFGRGRQSANRGSQGVSGAMTSADDSLVVRR